MQLNHVRLGSGKPLLLVPGLGASWQSWDTILDALVREREVIAIDLPGSGATPPLPGGVSIATLCDAVAGFIDEQQLSGIDLVGSSTGARMVLELARRGVGGTAVALDPGGFWSLGQQRVFGHRSSRCASCGAMPPRRHSMPPRSRHLPQPSRDSQQAVPGCATALVRSLRALPALGRPGGHRSAHPRQHRLMMRGTAARRATVTRRRLTSHRSMLCG